MNLRAVLNFGKLLKNNPSYNIKSFLENTGSSVQKKVEWVQFPERLKGTFVEAWKTYWMNVLRDYSDAVKEIFKVGKEKPKKAVLYISLIGFTVYCTKTNPDDQNFRDAVISYSHEIIFVGTKIRNPHAVEYLKFIEDNYNHENLERFSFGLFSIIWKHNYSDYISLYKAHCPYIGIRYVDFYKHIIDIGFLNKWWILEYVLKDFDVNPEEWKKD